MPTMGNIEFLVQLFPLLIYSTICGGMIGFERGRRGSAAGMKTQIFICVGSALFTFCSISLVDAHSSADAGRIIAQIVSGVGFLGAGTIMAKDKIIGLTTAAIIWVMAALGVMIGLGYGPAAVIVTLGMLIAILIITELERRFIPTHFENPHQKSDQASVKDDSDRKDQKNAG
jgi:putative Mg2+ transporter-C (MgtC) family protein